MARKASRPPIRRILYGIEKNGSEMNGYHTAATGFVTTELGMNLNAMILVEEINEDVDKRTKI